MRAVFAICKTVVFHGTFSSEVVSAGVSDVVSEGVSDGVSEGVSDGVSTGSSTDDAGSGTDALEEEFFDEVVLLVTFDELVTEEVAFFEVVEVVLFVFVV